MKKIILTISTTVILMSLCACTKEVVPVEQNIPYIQKETDTGEKIQTSQELEVKNEPFTLVCEYDTGRYDLQKWRVTDSKSVGMTAYLKNLPEGYEVYIDHVHADISLKSTSAQIDGIIQDTMDDTCHAITQNGFYIDNNTKYYNVFAIEGYTQQFYELWGNAFGNYGQISTTYEKLTENNIVEVGTYAEKLQVVYDLSIKAPGEEHFHNVSVLSEIMIPVNQDTSQNTKEVGIFEE